MSGVRLSPHLSLCSRGVSTKNTPLPVMSVHAYLHGRAMRRRKHCTRLAAAIARDMCGTHKGSPLWFAIWRTPPRDWSTVVLLVDGAPVVDGVPVVDWQHLILVDYGDTDSWGPLLTRLVLRELKLIAIGAQT